MSAPSNALTAPIIYEFRDYKAYLNSWIASRPGQGRGAKSLIARHLKCHLAYVSQVLRASAHFSPEQADALNRLLEHTEDKADFFLLLVHRGRAGTRSLEEYYDRKIQLLLEQRLLLKNRLADKKSIRREEQAIYYSAWYYAAIHMGVLVPELRTPLALARYFGLSLEKTTRAIDFLVSVGLVQEIEGRLQTGIARIHLEHDSPMISKHHANWRMQAIQSQERESADELHYSSVVSVSRQDTPRVREILVKAIEEVRGVIKDSKDECIYCYDLDFFALGGSEK